MTDPKRTRRRRRSASLRGSIPIQLVRWFDGSEPELPLLALIPPEHEMLGVFWKRWLKLHPDARLPADGGEWIAAQLEDDD